MDNKTDVVSVLGIDLGSRNIKLSLMKNDSVVCSDMYDTVEFYRKFGIRSDEGLQIDLASLGFGAVERCVATGYGRTAAAIGGAGNITEITAHYLGALFQTNLEDFTLLDIGGQDFKIISVVSGELRDFVTNDKCAASTGRYLENMANVLGITLEEISRYHENPVELTTTCAIFSESELVGHIVRGETVERLAAGVNRSIVERFLPYLNRFGDGPVVLSGGVAHNGAVKRLMTEQTGREVVMVDDPVHNGAIGCCVSGMGDEV